MRHLLARYRKGYTRLRRAIATHNRPTRGLLDRLRRYERQLQRAGITVATTASLFIAPDTLVAQAQPVGGETQVNTYTTGFQFRPATAMDADGDYIIVWGGEGQGDTDGIFGQRYNADGTTAGAEFKVNTYTTSSQRLPSVAMDADGDFVVTWQSENQDGSAYGIFTRRYQADGTALDANDVQVNTHTTSNQLAPSVAMDADGDFVVAWQSNGQDGSSYGIFARRYQADGTALDASDVQVNTYTTDRQQNPSVAMNADGDFVVAWESNGQDGSVYGIFARRYQADGTALDASDVQVNVYTTSVQFTPSVAMDADGNFVVAWSSFGQDGSNFGISARRYQANGTALDASDILVNTYTSNHQFTPSVAMDADGDFVVVWESQGQDGSFESVFAQQYQADGTAVGSEIQVNTYTTNYQREPSVAMAANGDFVVAWESGNNSGATQDGSAFGVYAQRYRVPLPGSVPAGSETQVNTYTTNYQSAPAIAMDAVGRYVTVWEGEGQGDFNGIFGQRYNADGTTAGGEFRINVHTTNNQSSPSVAMDASGDFVVAWQSRDQDGSYEGIFARRYQADGTALDANDFQVNTYTTNRQRNPSVAMDADGDFVVAWQSNGQDGSLYGVFARRYQANGTALDASDFQINTYTTDRQQNPSVAMDADGDFVVAWESFGQTGGSFSIFMRRYQANGTALDASDVQVNTYTTSFQSNPSVAMDADGGFVVAWEGYRTAGNSFDIFTRRYQANGTALDASDVQVNTYTTSDQLFPSVAMDADGNFVVAWEGFLQDGDSNGVFAQQYQADGTPMGSEIQVNTYTTSRQQAPSVAMADDGDFVVAWESGYYFGTTQDGSYYGIYAQRYDNPALPVKLADLRATALERTNLLEWITATESANEGFAVQRSYDGKQWEVIGWVAGAGESYNATAYTYEDMQPREGVTYYRLEQLDYDGMATLTEVVSVVRMEDEVTRELRAYPNPVNGLLTVENAGAELRLYALTGQLITDVSLRVLTKATNGDDRATLDMSGLAEGVYLLTTTLDNGTMHQVRVMVR